MRRVLWIMCDQLRHDYLGCAGHPALETPNIDRLAARGVRFERAYVQSPVCGPSRMSFYTGRYVRQHGSTMNGVPLRAGEPTLGQHLTELGVRTILVGKTHVRPDRAGMTSLGLGPGSDAARRIAEGGFEVFERDDGLHPDGPYDASPAYDDYLRRHGFEAGNPWQDWANAAEDADGHRLSGWLMENADKPARVPAEHSETAYMTGRALDCIEAAEAEGRPWLIHLSYIKPHWPYIVPAPYHALYGAGDVQAVVRAETERAEPHPVYGAFMAERASRAFAREEVRRRVVPAYMGLIKEIDDQLGRLFDFLEARGLFEETLIVFCSDHGDYLGDHWLGEKDFFHDAAVRIPLILCDPGARATRGTVSQAPVEGIDLAPTFLEWFGGEPKPQVLEGRSLLPDLRGEAPPEGRLVFSEYDYANRGFRRRLGRPVSGCRLAMAFDGRWKYVHAEGFRPLLFDLESDPDELLDLGADPAHAAERERLHRAMFDWALGGRNRITVREQDLEGAVDGEVDNELPFGILIGYWDEAELAEAWRRYRERKGE